MDAPKLNPQESLKASFPKLNQSIDNANEALRRSGTAVNISNNAINVSNEAKGIAERTQSELSQAILEGDSSPLAGQLSVGADGTVYEDGPQERFVSEFNKISTDLDGRGINILTKIQIPEQTIDNAIQRAYEEVMLYGGRIILPAKSTPYKIANTVILGNRDNQRTFTLEGEGSQGSYYGEKSVVIQRLNATDSFDMFRITARGYLISNICFDGQGYGDLVACERGFEARFYKCRFYRAGNRGLIAQSFQNSDIDLCFFDECRKGLALRYGLTFGVCNTVHINKCHFERNTDIDLELGVESSDTDTQMLEYIFVNQCHFESGANTGGVAKSVPQIAVGNVRECYIDNCFLYGGKVDLIRIDQQRNYLGTKYNGVSITNTSFTGHLSNHYVDANTPPRLINLKSGNGFYMAGCTFDGATQQMVRIESTFGEDVNILPCYVKSREGTTNVAIQDNRNGVKDYLTMSLINDLNIIKNLYLGNPYATWKIGNAKGTETSTELNISPENDSRTISFDTQNGTRVMSMYMNNNSPRWGIFGQTAQRQTITGNTDSEKLASVISLLKAFGLST